MRPTIDGKEVGIFIHHSPFNPEIPNQRVTTIEFEADGGKFTAVAECAYGHPVPVKRTMDGNIRYIVKFEGGDQFMRLKGRREAANRLLPQLKQAGYDDAYRAKVFALICPEFSGPTARQKQALKNQIAALGMELASFLYANNTIGTPGFIAASILTLKKQLTGEE